MTSEIRKSGQAVSAALRASRGLVNYLASNPSWVRIAARVIAITASSSTTNTVERLSDMKDISTTQGVVKTSFRRGGDHQPNRGSVGHKF